MSIRIMSVVWELPIEPTQKLLLLAIADHADDIGMNAYPSVARLAERCTVSERTVQYALRKLEREGWIAVQRRATRYQPTCYRVSLDGPKRAPEQPEEGDDRGAESAPLDESGVQPATVRGATDVVSGVQRVAPDPSLNRPRTKSAGDPPAPPDERFDLGGFVDDYAELTGGILPVGMSARPLRDVARLYGLDAARSGWRAYVAARHKDARPIKAAWFAEEAGRWCKAATDRATRPVAAAPRHPLWGWVREHTPARRNDPDPGYRAWVCPECEQKRLVPTERDGYGREIPAPTGKVYIARHEAFDPSLVGKCPAELGYEVDGWGRVVGIAEVRRAK